MHRALAFVFAHMFWRLIISTWCYIAIKNKIARPITQNHHVMWIKLFLVSVLYFYSTFNFSANKNRKQNRNSTLFVPTKTEAKFHNRTSLGPIDYIKLPLRFTYVYYLFVSVALICFVVFLRKIFLSKMCILHCRVPLNSVLFKPCSFRFIIQTLYSKILSIVCFFSVTTWFLFSCVF